MQNNKKLEELRNKLPLGSKVLISERTGLNPRTIENVLNGKPARIKNVMIVIGEAEKVIAEYKELTGN
jgi:pheromone shutdown protein TraB